jgi:integrase
VAELLEAAQSSRYAPLSALLVHTGLRRGEALALRWTDVDLERKTLRVRGTLARIDGDLVVTDPKTAKSRRFVPISAPTERILRDIRTTQAQQRLLARSRWRATRCVFTTELGEPCDPRECAPPSTSRPPRPAFRALGCTPSGTPPPA